MVAKAVLWTLLEGHLLTLIVATTHASTPCAANSINFINKNDAWSIFLGLQTQERIGLAIVGRVSDFLDSVSVACKDLPN